MVSKVTGPAWVRPVRLALLASMVLLFLFAQFIDWALPTTWWGTEVWSKVVIKDLNTKHLDSTEGRQLFTTVPWIAIAVLGPLYLALPKPVRTEADAAKGSKPPSRMARFWNAILFANPTVGVITVKEVFWCLYVLAWCVFVESKYMDRQMNRIYENRKKYKLPIGDYWIEYFALFFGFVIMPLLNLLMIPVARGTVLLRLIKLPFEKAIRYHIWLGWLVILLTFCHGLGYIILFTREGTLKEKMWVWKDKGINASLGAVALLSALVMLASSQSYFRRRHFDTFFRLHHLYIAFIAFAAMHLGEWFFRYTVPGLFLFGLDRFQRFLQSRRNATVLATRTMPDGTTQVEVAKYPQASTNPLDVLFINIPAISRLQWHPFSLASHHQDSATSFIFHVKNLGTWTNDTCRMVDDLSSPRFDVPAREDVPKDGPRCPLSSLKVEGFYGAKETYFLKYPILVLVAGGSGIVPFGPILKDLLYRHKEGDQAGLPTQVVLVWAVKTSAELAPLSDISPEDLCPGVSSKLNLDIRVYVTQEAGPKVNAFPLVRMASVQEDRVQPMLPQISNLQGSVQESLYLLTTFLGTWLFYYLAIVCIIDPRDDVSNKKFSLWKRGLVYLAALIVGVVVSSIVATMICYFGNRVFAKRAEQNPSGKKSLVRILEKAADTEDTLLHRATVTYRERPDLEGIFGFVCKHNEGKHVGVLTSGPSGLTLAVANICRARNGILGGNEGCYLSYHSVSFEL